MIENVYWKSRRSIVTLPSLQENLEADAVVVGGGIAGLSAAQWLCENTDLTVVLTESRYCGAGATGRSSGFITPDSELELNQLARRFGDRDAAFLWSGATDGCKQIRHNIETFNLRCDKVEADSLFIANRRRSFSSIREEWATHQRLGFPCRLYRESEIPSVLGTHRYAGGIRTEDSFGINAFEYAQQLRDVLIGQGVKVFENTPALRIAKASVQTPHGDVQAKHIFVCVDRFAPSLEIAKRSVYHAQTFLALTERLDDAVMREIFPEKSLLVWDTELIYQYFRQTGDNRLLIGGGLPSYSFRRHAQHGRNRAVELLMAYIRNKFPALADVPFTHYWPGMIGIAKDVLPLAGRSPAHANHFYAMCSAGLPWSTLAGRIAAQQAVAGKTDFDRFFSPCRSFSPLEPLQSVLPKPVTFALTTYYAKEHQRGDSVVTSRMKRWVGIASSMLAAASLGYIAHKLRRT